MIKHSKILLVEDDPIIQLVHSQYLSDLGYEYDLAKTGKEAIAFYNENEYSLMLLDKQLSDMDSTEFCRLVRIKHSMNELPIFILTACGNIAKNECLQAGCNEFFVKPVDKDTLGKAIKQWIRLSEATLSNHSIFTISKRSAKNVNFNAKNRSESDDRRRYYNRCGVTAG